MPLPAREQIELEAKLLILEQLVAQLYAERLSRLDDPSAAFHEMQRSWLTERPTFRPGVDPSQSDLVAAEVSLQAEKILAVILGKLSGTLS